MPLRESVLNEDRFTEKERRNLAILDIIRRSREISRAEISRVTHLNIVTVSNYIDDYIKKDLVLEKGLDVSTGGRRPELLELNPKYGYSIGIDLGPPHIMEDASIIAVMIDVNGRVVQKSKVKKEEGLTQDDFIERIEKLVGDLLEKSRVDKGRIKGIGAGIWGVLDRNRGTVRYAVEKGGLFSFSALQLKMEKSFGIPTLVEHDAACGALGEKWIGVGLKTDAENILYVCSDSSCGFILNGELYYGSSKSAGELNINPPVSPRADKNCWASYDYGCCLRSRGIDLGITTRAKLYFKSKKTEDSKLFELANEDTNNITMGLVVKAAKLGDPLAKGLLQEAGEYLGTKIAFLLNIFNPDAVVIGRGIETAGEIFLDAVRASVNRWAYEETLKVASLVPTSLGEDSIASGSACFVMQKVFARI